MNAYIRVLQAVFALTFIFSAYTKWVGPGFFEILLIDQGIVEARHIAAILTRLIIGLELSLGIFLLTPFYKKTTLWLSLGLLFIFTAHLFYLWAIGDTDNCGCFGEMISMSPQESIFKNALLMVLNGILLYFQKKTSKNNTALVVIPLTSLVFVFVTAPIKTLEVSTFQSFTHFENKGIVDLTQGERFVAVFNTECEHCQEAAIHLVNLQKQYSNFPTIFVLFFSEGTMTPEEFNFLTGSSFPYTSIDVNSFFDLIGNSPPRLYRIMNGQITDIWDEDLGKNVENKLKN